jgi:hypothetical protein
MEHLIQLSGYHILKKRDAPRGCTDAVQSGLTARTCREVQRVVTIPLQFCVCNAGSYNRHQLHAFCTGVF